MGENEMGIRIFETDYNNNRFWAEKTEVSDGADMMRVVNRYPQRTYQTVNGFGGAFTEASGYNLKRLPETVQEEILDAYFAKDGLRYNLCRTHINSCDFALGNYAYVEDENDTDFAGFDIGRDHKYIIPSFSSNDKIKPITLRFLFIAGQHLNLIATL